MKSRIRIHRERKALVPVILLMAASACLLLAGCGGKKKTDSASQGASSETTSAAAGSGITSSEMTSAAAGSGITSSEVTSAAAGSGITSSEVISAAAGSGITSSEMTPVSSGPDADDSGAATGEEELTGQSAGSSAEEPDSSGILSFSLGGTINSVEDMADAAASGVEASAAAGGAILPGLGKISITPLEKNELSQYIGMSFDSLEKKFEGIEAEVSFGVRSYGLGEAVGDRKQQVGMTGSESGGVITKINLYAGQEYKIAGIKAGMDLDAAEKAAGAAGFEKVQESENGLVIYQAPDGLSVTVYSSDGSTVDTVTCENR